MYGTILSGKFIEHKMCVLSLSYKFASNISHSEKNLAGCCHKCFGSSCKVPAFKHWGPSSLLYNGYRVFLGDKERPGRDTDPPPPSSAVVKKE